jgi:hypothetical protein
MGKETNLIKLFCPLYSYFRNKQSFCHLPIRMFAVKVIAYMNEPPSTCSTLKLAPCSTHKR